MSVAYQPLQTPFAPPQVQVGHVRLMLPCGESHTSASQEEAASPSAAALERSNSAFASVDTDSGQQAPNMLVVVLAGFQATSRTTEARVSGYASPGEIAEWHAVSYIARHLHDQQSAWPSVLQLRSTVPVKKITSMVRQPVNAKS